jgi:hypothetical protein
LRASEFRKQLKVVKVADFLSEQAVWIVHASHIGRLASVIQTLRGVVKRSLCLKSKQPALFSDGETACVLPSSKFSADSGL